MTLVRKQREYRVQAGDPEAAVTVPDAQWMHCSSCGEDILSSELETATKRTRRPEKSAPRTNVFALGEFLLCGASSALYVAPFLIWSYFLYIHVMDGGLSYEFHIIYLAINFFPFLFGPICTFGRRVNLDRSLILLFAAIVGTTLTILLGLWASSEIDGIDRVIRVPGGRAELGPLAVLFVSFINLLISVVEVLTVVIGCDRRPAG